MILDRDNASAALDEIESTESKTWQAVIYGYSANFLFIWGVLVSAGYLANQFYPDWAGLIWPAVWIVGGATSVALGSHHSKVSSGKDKTVSKLYLSVGAIMGFAALLLWLLWPVSARQLNVYWPMIFMLCYVLAGIWVGRFFWVCGLCVIALSVAGYLFSGPWLPLWMAFANGGALILGGFYLRRVGLRL